MARPIHELDIANTTFIVKLYQAMTRGDAAWIIGKKKTAPRQMHSYWSSTVVGPTRGRVQKTICGYPVSASIDLLDKHAAILGISAPGWKAEIKMIEAMHVSQNVNGLKFTLAIPTKNIHRARTFFLLSATVTNPEKFRHQMTMMTMFESEWADMIAGEA